jgi:hypothetical protein
MGGNAFVPAVVARLVLDPRPRLSAAPDPAGDHAATPAAG